MPLVFFVVKPFFHFAYHSSCDFSQSTLPSIPLIAPCLMSISSFEMNPMMMTTMKKKIRRGVTTTKTKTMMKTILTMATRSEKTLAGGQLFRLNLPYFAAGSDTNRYPTPRTVSKCFGLEGSSSR